jgi:hypothetical protein
MMVYMRLIIADSWVCRGKIVILEMTGGLVVMAEVQQAQAVKKWAGETPHIRIKSALPLTRAKGHGKGVTALPAT